MLKGLQMLNALKGLTGDPSKMIQQVVQMITPPMLGFLEKYNKPISEGGLLNREDVNCIFAIMPMRTDVDGTEVQVMVPHILTVGYDAQLARYTINAKHSLDELLKKAEQDGALNEGKDEEE
ncbi:hypothetical protein [Phaeodactylibacter sp.]|uniref:hypothetical protein n=1 Tax=Phaeodactylibacter sp. TaxID=1940289 RepID=UPI0025E3754F|nr:hypothetical protein [Phaeodactylibacter sp.]MCI4650845.1 hypothetical protein [Phaeodactylibacter sp.]MCI5089802.1 hypothetical protein [Phaeodactylibacter sp.]